MLEVRVSELFVDQKIRPINAVALVEFFSVTFSIQFLSTPGTHFRFGGVLSAEFGFVPPDMNSQAGHFWQDEIPLQTAPRRLVLLQPPTPIPPLHFSSTQTVRDSFDCPVEDQ